MTNYVNINPGPTNETTTETKREFSALVRVESSRYAEHKYQDESIQSKIGIKWTMRSTKDNTFERSWSTGLNWDPTLISKDGKKLTQPIRKNSDAQYLLRKAINEAGFPSTKVTDDISVFEGETFYIATDQNPLSQGSARKPYPKLYHPEGWETAKAEVIRKREERNATEQAQFSNETATMTRSYSPPVVIQQDVKKTATEALVAILTKSGGRAVQKDLLTGLNAYLAETGTTGWTPAFRENVTRAIWEHSQISSIIEDNPRLSIEGGPIGFTVILK